MANGPGNNQQNEQLASKIINRQTDIQKRFWAQIQAPEFDAIIAQYLTDNGMYASRAALISSKIIDLLKIAGYLPALELTEKDRYLITITLIFHDVGVSYKKDNSGDHKLKGAELCAKYLQAKGYSAADIAKVTEVLMHDNWFDIQEKNIYALIVAASNVFDYGAVRNASYILPKKLRGVISASLLKEFSQRCRQVMIDQKNSISEQFDQEYELSGQCYSKTSSLYEKHFAGFEKLCREKYSELDKLSHAINYRDIITKQMMLKYNLTGVNERLFKAQHELLIGSIEQSQPADDTISDVKINELKNQLSNVSAGSESNVDRQNMEVLLNCLQ